MDALLNAKTNERLVLNVCRISAWYALIQLGAQLLMSHRKDQAGKRKFKSTGFGGKKVQEQVLP